MIFETKIYHLETTQLVIEGGLTQYEKIYLKAMVFINLSFDSP
ncbi:MAG: hypothetical protein K0S04_3902 [Herbinix sp.]|jgi:hypothetical protein|nr:hypothetical protein [Herbinix sp.]